MAGQEMRRWKTLLFLLGIFRHYIVIQMLKVKVRQFELQALTGPEDFRRLRLPDFKTFGT
jgi:hypothetical protein